MVFEDWKLHLSILIQMGWLDIFGGNAVRNLFEAESRLEYETNADGRLYRLDVTPGTPHSVHYFPDGVLRLDCLETLEISRIDVPSLPFRELNTLPKLERLEVYLAPKFSLSDLPDTEKLHRVKILVLSDVHSLHLLRICPSVEHLQPCLGSSGDVDAFLHHLGSIEVETLHFLNLCIPEINGEQLAKLMLDVVPRFPNLEKLRFCDCCEIHFTDFRILSERLRSGESSAISKSLRSLDIEFAELPLYRAFKAFTADMLTLLKFFPTIDSLNWRSYVIRVSEDFHTDPEWTYAMVKNAVGRRIIRGGSSSHLPLSIWPIVLQRAQRKNFHRECFGLGSHGVSGLVYGESLPSLAATGIYYLLREGSALIGRRDLVNGCPERSRPSKRQKQS